MKKQLTALLAMFVLAGATSALARQNASKSNQMKKHLLA
jgi:hypothetical protein